MRSGDGSRHKLILNVLAVNLKVFCTLMKNGISNDEDSVLTIIMHGYW